jgi:hypothetical protein
MPFLGDYIGQLMSEITVARLKADLEAIRIAELYASHPLLRHMPVPHFRLPDVQLDVPVGVPNSESSKVIAPQPGTTSFAATIERFHNTLSAELLRRGIQMPPEKQTALRAAVSEAARGLDLPHEVAVDTNRIADKLSDAVATQLRSERPAATAGPQSGPDPIETLREGLRAQARLDLLKAKSAPTRLAVLVTTQEVREAGPQNIMRLTLKITEDNVEWTSIEKDGKTTERLVQS